jgi:hypothetical protein
MSLRISKATLDTCRQHLICYSLTLRVRETSLLISGRLAPILSDMQTEKREMSRHLEHYLLRLTQPKELCKPPSSAENVSRSFISQTAVHGYNEMWCTVATVLVGLEVNVRHLQKCYFKSLREATHEGHTRCCVHWGKESQQRSP